MTPLKRSRRLSPTLLAVLLSCVADSSAPTGPEPEVPGTPVVVQAASGDAQAGSAESALGAPLVVRVGDARGRGVGGVAVSWIVSAGGGTVSPASTHTDSTGQARATWTLGAGAGTHTVTASVAGLAAATFTATAALPPPARVEAEGGDGQTGAVGVPLADSLGVRVATADGRPAPGVAVAWTVTGGGGALSAATATTGANGVARVQWTLGAAAGANSAEASVAGVAGSPVAFRATARAGSASALVRVGGDAQSAPAGSALPAPLVVRVADARGNPVAGAGVTWMVAAGGGSVTPAIAITDAEGLARAAWTLGTVAGANSVTAAAVGATVGFAAVGTAGPAARVSQAGGDGQSAPAGSALAAPLAVKVADSHGNAVAGAAVGWTVTGGGGSLAPAAPATDAAGRATAAWTLGSAAGANGTVATVTGVGSVAFGATGTAGAAAGLDRVAGDGQSGPAGSPLPSPLVVRVVDGRGNPVAGASVSWAATAGGGSLAPAASPTHPAGPARPSWTLGGSVGANTAAASTPGAAPVAFGATATPGSAAALARVAGDGQSAVVGTLLPEALVVRVADARGNPVSGAAVAWAVAGGGGSVSAATATTGADGTAATRWTLGGAAGPQAVSAGVGGAAVSFGAVGTAGAAARLVKVAGDAQSGVVGTGVPARLVAQATDAFGNPVAGIQVAWTVASGGGTVVPATGTTGADGSVSTQWTLGPTPGAQSVAASAAGLAGASFGAAAAAGPPATVTVSPAAASLERGSSLQLAAAVRDAFGNLLADRQVTWSSGYSPGATVSGTGLVFGVLAGQVTITAASEGKTGQSVVTVVPAQDAVPPALTGLSFTPATVDVTSADARIEFTVTATDAGSGIRDVNVALWRPNTNAWAPRCETVALVGGTRASGTWKCTLTIVRGSEPGTYRVNPSLTDYNDNHRTYTPDQVAAAGFPVAITVASSAGPPAPAALTAFSFAPTAVDVRTGPARVEFTVGITSGAGVRRMEVAVPDPASGSVVYGCMSESPAAGNVKSGTWKCSIDIGHNAPAGSWRVRHVAVLDSTGANRFFNTDALAAAGFPTTIAVTSTSDATAPSLTGLSLSPATVNLSDGEKTVEIGVTGTDPETGIREVGVDLSVEGTGASLPGCGATVFPSASAAPRTISCPVRIPVSTPSGKVFVERVHLTDAAGNRAWLSRQQLVAAGFPTAITVTR